MANIIIKSDERREEVDFVLRSYSADRQDPEMRDAAETIAARTAEAIAKDKERSR